MSDPAWDNTYANNPSRFDSTPTWHEATSITTDKTSTPKEDDIYVDSGVLYVYTSGSWNAISGSGGGGGGAVDSVNGKTGTVVLKEVDISRVLAVKTGTYTITTADDIILADATSAAFNLTLPTAVGFKGSLTILATATNTHLVTVKTVSSQTISGGGTSVTLGTTDAGAPYQAITLVSDNSNWWIV